MTVERDVGRLSGNGKLGKMTNKPRAESAKYQLEYQDENQPFRRPLSDAP